MPKRVTFFFISCLLVGFASQTYSLQQQPAMPPALTSAQAPIEQLTPGIFKDAVVFDFNADGRSEIVLTDIRGNLLALDAATGKRLWLDEHPGRDLSPPIVGNFLGELGFQVLVIDENGKITLYDGLTGEKRVVEQLVKTYQAGPSLLPQCNDGIMGDRDGFVFINEDKELKFCRFRSELELNVHHLDVHQTIALTEGAMNLPPVVVEADGQPGWEVLVANDSGKIFFCRIDSSRPFFTFTLPLGRSAAQPPVVAQLRDDQAYQLIVADNEGEIHVHELRLEAGGGSTTRLYTIRELAHPALMQPIVFDLAPGGPRGILTFTQSTVAVFGGAHQPEDPSRPELAAQRTIGRMALVNPVSLAVVRYDPGRLEFVIAEAGGNVVRYQLGADGLTRDTPYSLRVALSEPMLAGPMHGSATAVVFLVDSSGNEGHLLRVEHAEGFPPFRWAIGSGSFTHSGLLDDPGARQHRDLQEKLKAEIDNLLQVAHTAFDDRKWEEVSAVCDQALLLDPFNEEAKNLKKEVIWNKYKIMIIAGALLAVALLFVALYFVHRGSMRHWWLRRGKAAESAGHFDQAVACYHRVWRRFPNDLDLLARCGRLYYQLGQFDNTTAPVFEKNLELTPGQEHYQLAVAQCRMAAGDSSSETMDILHRVAKFAKPAAPYEYYLGQCLLHHENKAKARHWIAAAIEHGEDSAEARLLLVELCMELKHYSATALVQYELLWEERCEDPDYLESFCEALLELRRFDDPAPLVCRQVLSFKPDLIVALQLQANISLHEGETDKAEECANRILRQEQDNKQGLWIRCHCLISRDETGEVALQVCLDTLKVFPDDPSINRHAARALRRQGRADDQTIEILHHALELNPGDPELMTAVADMDLRQNNNEHAIALLEELVNTGSSNKENLLLLAEAYLSTDCRDRKAEKAYWMAHREHPDSPEYLQALSEVLMAEKNLDERALAVYAKLRRHQPEDLVLARQTARALYANQRFGEAAELAKQLMKLGDADDELRQLYAEASLKSNRLDAAIDEFRGLLERKPHDQRATLNLALALAEKKLTNPDSLSLYRRGLEIAPREPLLLRALGRDEAAQRNYKQAVDFFQGSLRADKASALAVIGDLQQLLVEDDDALLLRWHLARILIDINHFSDALEELLRIADQASSQSPRVIKALDLILNKDPDNPIALLYRGRLRLGAGQHKYSRQDLEKAHQLSPNNQEISQELCELYSAILAAGDDIELRFHLGEIQYQLQEYDKAIACFQAVVKDYRWENQATLMLGKCFYGKGMLDLALQEFRKLPIDDETKALLYDLGRTYEKQGDMMGAKTAYRQIFAADISYRDVREKFELLAGTSSSVNVFEKTSALTGLSEEARKRYELIEEVGRGAMGIVYKANDRELDEVVAIKILPENLAKNTEALQRFKQEARSARRLTHRNIVRIHDIGEEGGRKYISMEFIEGQDLKELCHSPEGVGVERTVLFVRQIADALDYAHSMGIIHRDIKPANILITPEDEVKVTDFGIAKIIADSDQTMPGIVLGTPLYMSPEQILGRPPDPRSDLYSLGILLYECLSGKPPYTEGDLASQHLTVIPPTIEGIPADLDALVQKCLHKNIEERCQSGAEIVAALADYQQ